jgi:hypothetical protein
MANPDLSRVGPVRLKSAAIELGPASPSWTFGARPPGPPNGDGIGRATVRSASRTPLLADFQFALRRAFAAGSWSDAGRPPGVPTLPPAATIIVPGRSPLAHIR